MFPLLPLLVLSLFKFSSHAICNIQFTSPKICGMLMHTRIRSHCKERGHLHISNPINEPQKAFLEWILLCTFLSSFLSLDWKSGGSFQSFYLALYIYLPSSFIKLYIYLCAYTVTSTYKYLPSYLSIYLSILYLSNISNLSIIHSIRTHPSIPFQLRLTPISLSPQLALDVICTKSNLSQARRLDVL